MTVSLFVINVTVYFLVQPVKIFKISFLILCILTLNILTGCTKKYTVTFITNNDTVIENQIVKKGEKVIEPEKLEKYGYTFDGWYLDNEKWSFIEYSVTKNITLEAKWQINTYEITYDLNDGLATNPKTYTIEDEITLNNPTKVGYTFIGWTSDDIENPQLNVTIKNEINNKHFIANYTPNEYTITFEPSLEDDLNPITVVYNNEYEDSYWENLEENGFVSYDILKKQVAAEYEAEEKATRISGTKPLSTYKLPYDESASDIEKINSARFENDLIYIYKLVSESAGFISTPEFEEAYTLMKEKLDGVTRNDYLYYVKNKLILSNNKYDLYFNFTTTQFELKEKDENGKVINSWSSTPKEYDINNQSIFRITCVDGAENTTETPIEYDSYLNSSYSYSEMSIYPSFSINVVKDSNGDAEKIIVYYTLKQKGIDPAYIPNKIILPRVRELIERCNKLVAEYKEENNGEYPVDSSGRKITELGFLTEINGINPATGKPFDSSSREFYYIIFSDCYGRIYFNENGEELPFEEQYYKLKYGADQMISYCYRFFYEWCGYTVDELVIDTGVEKHFPTTPIINVAIEYKLGENGLEIMIPNNSVKTNKNDEDDYYIVTSINLLPYIVVSE